MGFLYTLGQPDILPVLNRKVLLAVPGFLKLQVGDFHSIEHKKHVDFAPTPADISKLGRLLLAHDLR